MLWRLLAGEWESDIHWFLHCWHCHGKLPFPLPGEKLAQAHAVEMERFQTWAIHRWRSKIAAMQSLQRLQRVWRCLQLPGAAQVPLLSSP